MRISLFICLFFLFNFKTFGQNLVPNPDFEDTIACPNGFGGIICASPWTSYLETPDYFNFCASSCTQPSICFGIPNNWFGSQQPYSGNGYSGLSTYSFGVSNDREVIGVRLINPLLIEKKYYFSCYISRAAGLQTKGATNNFGFRFSTVPFNISSGNGMPINNFSHYHDTTIVVDSIGWTRISGSFIADSAYQYLALGNFYDDANTDTIDMNPMGQPWNYAYYYVDYVCVTPDSGNCILFNSINQNINSNVFSVSPNPFNDYIDIVSTMNDVSELIIYDVFGRKIVSKLIFNKESINLGNIGSGLYLYVISKNGLMLKSGKLLKK